MIIENIVLFKINVGGYSCSICNACFKFIYQHDKHIEKIHNLCIYYTKYRNNKEDLIEILKTKKNPIFLTLSKYNILYKSVSYKYNIKRIPELTKKKTYSSSCKLKCLTLHISKSICAFPYLTRNNKVFNDMYTQTP